MLGRPEMVVPVFMNVCAGSWLIASVTIDRMTQISSATPPISGKIVADLLARLAVLLERVLGGEAGELLPLELRDRHPRGERPRHRLAVHRGELRLVIERLQVRRPARHVQVNDPLRLRREVRRADDPRPPLLAGRRRRRPRSSPGFRSEARASAPSPVVVLPSRARRVRRSFRSSGGGRVPGPSRASFLGSRSGVGPRGGGGGRGSRRPRRGRAAANVRSRLAGPSR